MPKTPKRDKRARDARTAAGKEGSRAFASGAPLNDNPYTKQITPGMRKFPTGMVYTLEHLGRQWDVGWQHARRELPGFPAQPGDPIALGGSTALPGLGRRKPRRRNRM